MNPRALADLAVFKTAPLNQTWVYLRKNGADDGTRTHYNSLEGCGVTITLHPHFVPNSGWGTDRILMTLLSKFLPYIYRKTVYTY